MLLDRGLVEIFKSKNTIAIGMIYIIIVVTDEDFVNFSAFGHQSSPIRNSGYATGQRRIDGDARTLGPRAVNFGKKFKSNYYRAVIVYREKRVDDT